MKCYTCGAVMPATSNPIDDLTHPFCSLKCAEVWAGAHLKLPSQYPSQQTMEAYEAATGQKLTDGVLQTMVKETFKPTQSHDPVNHPSHYTSHPSGVECITITRHMTFNIGNVIKYVWRSGLKGEAPAVQDLKKAAFYLNDEIKRIESQQNKTV